MSEQMYVWDLEILLMAEDIRNKYEISHIVGIDQIVVSPIRRLQIIWENIYTYIGFNGEK